MERPGVPHPEHVRVYSLIDQTAFRGPAGKSYHCQAHLS